MVATQTKFRRGTNTDILGFVPAEGEIVVDMTNDRPVLGDGTKAGGYPIPNFVDIQMQSFTRGTVGGTADAITLTLTTPILAYASSLKLGFVPTSTNTGPVTIDVDGKGPQDLQKYDGSGLGDLEAGDLVPGVYYEIYHDGSQFQMASSGSGITAVSQGDLNTLTGSVSVSSSSSGATSAGLYTLPGGEYGFYPNIEAIRGTSGNSPTYRAQIFSLSGGGSQSSKSCKIFLSVGNSTSTSSPPSLAAYQRYITSSPPYDLGDGDVAGFIFAIVDKNGEIIGTYAADTPPWAYNGPTDIRCTHKCKITGKKFRKVAKKKTFEQIMDGARTKFVMDEITNNVKNADMALIPHPFGEIPEGCTVVLIDPMEDKVRRMMEYQNSGGDLSEQLTSGKIIIDNEKIKRKGPKGVPIHKMKYKFSGGK